MTDELQQAIEHHRAGRLEEAGRLYRRVLAVEPAQADALHFLGLVEHQAGRHAAAIPLLEAAIRARGDRPRYYCNLGVVLLEQQRPEAAAEALEAALTRRPDYADAHYNLGLVRKLQLRLDDAAQCFRRALEIAPAHAQALGELGDVLRLTGKTDDALAAYSRSLAIDPQRATVLLAAADLARETGDLDGAAALYERVLVVEPKDAAALTGLGAVVRRRGNADGALDYLARALALDPTHAAAHRQRGFAFRDLGRLAESAEAFLTGTRLLRAPGSVPAQRLFTFSRTSRAKLEHDREQLEYLVGRGRITDADGSMRDAIARLLEILPRGADAGRLVDLPLETEQRLRGFYNRLLQVSDAPRLDGPAVNPSLDAAAIASDYASREPGITWIDGLLTTPALASLRNYCLESTLWFDFTHANGYLGAYMEDGFCCPLLMQIAEELPRALPGIFGRHRLVQLWAYKYDSRLSGIDMHADSAAINVNFWLTPSDANLDPASGGLVVWDKEAPADWSSKRYNSSELDDQAAIRGFLESSGAASVRVPHRQNRAVIFNSDLFHRTDDVRFREGYENRRINVTLLYGRRLDE
ncbi:MAG TPA: tetratricopeptide repeat protein [Gammaproteobacteria bacterium]|nr:tetratricopeptide repeat protein [Gammaproteobacteria bacterium]